MFETLVLQRSAVIKVVWAKFDSDFGSSASFLLLITAFCGGRQGLASRCCRQDRGLVADAREGLGSSEDSRASLVHILELRGRLPGGVMTEVVWTTLGTDLGSRSSLTHTLAAAGKVVDETVIRRPVGV